jgi:hypothetical protein
MYQYRVRVRTTPSLIQDAYLYADNDYAAFQLAESMYGRGNVVSWFKV